MPPRSPKMKRRILGFQRRVWWPKWTPASSSSRIETTDTRSAPFGLVDGDSPTGRAEPRSRRRHPRHGWSPGRRKEDRGSVATASSCDTVSHGSRPLEGHDELAGKRRLEIELGSRHGMDERQPVRMQELALETEVAPCPVRHVTRNRKLDRCEVDADLVRSSCLEADVEESVPRQELDHLEPRHGIARLVGVERAASWIATIPADGSVDPTGSRLRSPAYEREVTALDLTPADRFLKGREHVVRAGHD